MESQDELLRYECLCLIRQFCISPSISLLQSIPGGLRSDNQRWFIKKCINDELTRVFPRGKDFDRKLIRSVVVAAEEDGHELCEELMDAFMGVLLNKNELTTHATPSSWGYKIYAYGPITWTENNALDINAINLIKKWEERTMQVYDQGVSSALAQQRAFGDGHSGLLALRASQDMLAGSTGCSEWEAGFFMAEFVYNNPDLFYSARTCMEVGCGLGMATIAMARVVADRQQNTTKIICTDGDVETLSNCRHNLEINGVVVCDKTGPGVQVEKLVWDDGDGLDTFLHSTAPDIDIIIGADLLYDPLNIEPLIKLLKRVILDPVRVDDHAPAVAYIATTQRSDVTWRKILHALDREQDVLLVEDITLESHVKTNNNTKVTFHHILGLHRARERIVLFKITKRRHSKP